MRMLDLKPFETVAFVALRIVTGLMFAVHGAQKVLGIWAKEAAEVGTQIWFGGVIELACGLLIAMGLLTRVNAILSSGTMAVAYIQFHWKGAFDENFLPAINRGELAVVYCFLFLYIALRKDNPVSIDRLLFGKR
jgi:putative oxidoreductase